MLAFYIPCFVMVILYVQMYRAARDLQKRDRRTALWSGIFKNNNCSGNGDSVKSKKSASIISSPRKLHRPSAILHAVRAPLLSYIHRPSQLGEDKARKTLGVIMSVFIICWLPFFVLALVKSLYVTHLPQWLDTLVLWLGYSNSMLNPMIYCMYNREFRVPFREMLCCRFSTIQVVIRHESFHNKFGPPRIAGTHSGRRGTHANGVVSTGVTHERNNNHINNNDVILDEDEEYQM
ncbi:CBN-SER-7 protein [Aphelenchoides avenae]|nr:CBN-SER-7 protein [Aphelenchus avenae]